MHICGSRPLLVLLKVHTRPAGTWSHARARSSERLRPHRCDLAFVATPALLVATCKTAAAAAAAARAITALEAALQACLPSSPSWRALALIPESHQLATAAWPALPQAAWRSASPLTRAQTWSWCTSTSPRPSSPAPTCSSLTQSTVSHSNTTISARWWGACAVLQRCFITNGNAWSRLLAPRPAQARGSMRWRPWMARSSSHAKTAARRC